MDRFTFFLKYMDRSAGIHEVYLEEKKEDLMEFKEFKAFVDSKKDWVPHYLSRLHILCTSGPFLVPGFPLLFSRG